MIPAPNNRDHKFPVFDLPANLPTGQVCYQISLPDDPEYLDMFRGVLHELEVWNSYARDATHKGALVARIWKASIATLRKCPPRLNIGTGGYMRPYPLFRQNPLNPCQLQAQCPDGSWDTIFDASLCNPNPAPGGDTTPPTFSQCENYSLKFSANVLTPLPFVVNSGDTLTITSLQGAGTDGTPSWYCFNGQAFVLGSCSGAGFTSGSDPLPTALHMSVVVKIGSTYYAFASGTLTVPSGVVNQPIYIGVNDSPISDDVGTYSIQFGFCNNQTPPAGNWCESIDFTVSPSGWSALTGTDANGQPFGPAFWSAGQGWINHPQQPPPATTKEYYCLLRIDLGANYTINNVAITGHVGNASGGVLPEEVDVIFNVADSIGGTAVGLLVGHPSRNADYSLANTPTPATGRYLFVFSQGYGLSSPDDPIFTVKTLTVKGTGTNPFGASNCT